MALEPKYSFMAAVLGSAGASALQKAVEKTPALEAVLLPRTVLAFLGCATEWEYDGQLPGVGDSHFALHKNDDSSFTGEIRAHGANISFDHQDMYHVAAGLSLFLGLKGLDLGGSRQDQLQRLGKSIDLLAKAEAIRSYKKKVKKAEGPGPANAPTPQDGPVAPVGPTKQPGVSKPPAPKTVKVKNIPAPKEKVEKVKVPGIKLQRSQVRAKCPMCRHEQFAGDEFVGCFCFQDLAKSVSATVYPDGSAFLEFTSSEWDQDTVQTLLESMGRR